MTVTVTNTGDAATGKLSVNVSDNSTFKSSKSSILNINAGGSTTFTIKANAGLAAGTYKATVAVFNKDIGKETFEIEFKVKQ